MSEIYKIVMDMVLVIALFTTFAILLISKLGWRDYIIEHAKVKFISRLFSCDFCLCFWVSFLISMGLVMLSLDLRFLVIPFLSTPLARIFL